MRMEKHDGMTMTMENPSFVHQSCLAMLPAVIYRRNENLSLQSVFVHSCYFLHAVKSYDMGPLVLLHL
jgi:hypothetical protein